MRDKRIDAYQELLKVPVRELYEAIQLYFYTFHDSMDNAVIKDLGSEWVESELQKNKDSIISSVERLADIVGEKDALDIAQNKWNSLANMYEGDFQSRNKPFTLINMDFDQRIGKIF